MKTLRLILGDQLNINHSWFQSENQSNFLYVLMEVASETTYVLQHHQKVVGFFLAMRRFAEDLKKNNFQVHYIKINNTENTHDFIQNILKIIKSHDIQKIDYQLPDDYRLYQLFKAFKKESQIPVEAFETEHFYCSLKEISTVGEEKKYQLMENFYRYMRKKHQVLMDMGKPLGGKWNYDTENRKKWQNQVAIPQEIKFNHDVKEIQQDLIEAGIKTFGKSDFKNFDYPINREEALSQLTYFIVNLLPHFGDYQDAMHEEERLLFHSNLSFALNIKLINPKEVVEAVENSYLNKETTANLPQVEGFIRQIIGWREYVRYMYWQHYATFSEANFFNHHKSLPEVYWTGQSQMNCMKHCTQNSLDHAYAHHIQRLMVLGNFALLMETNPKQVDDWYLGVYIDAIEWVQLPNTRGMSQFADGGLLATKPYISSANYIDKMSNYCKNCHYDKKTKTAEDSCPFNSLYWHFLEKNRPLLQNNMRMKMMYALLEKMPNDEKVAVMTRAHAFIEKRNF